MVWKDKEIVRNDNFQRYIDLKKTLKMQLEIAEEKKLVAIFVHIKFFCIATENTNKYETWLQFQSGISKYLF